MAGLIPQAFIDDLIARADIVELIGSRVPLKKAGREFKACCPFHNEKSPSFWVSPAKQFYHCFGCGAHGTALGFLMNYDRLSFPEAIEELAGRLGIEVPREARPDPRFAGEAQLQDLTARVAAFYAQNLQHHPRALDYIRKRGLTGEALTEFAIGYASDSWNEVLKRFGSTEPARKALQDAGLIIERDGGAVRDGERHYDRFRDRIMFPIRDARGRVIGFGGRILDQGEPKYLNSPETQLFHKGRELYGLYEVRQSRVALKRLLVVEGYMDVVRLHQAGVQYAVATLGTATTPEHLKRAFRLVSEIVFCFDGDRAGRTAAWRALANALPEVRDGRTLRFLFLPDGHDPDSLVGEEGREAFEARIQGALPLSEYLVGELAAQHDLANADGRGAFAAAAMPLVGQVPESVFRDLLIERVAEAIKLPAQRLRAQWQRMADSPDASSARRATPRAAGNSSEVDGDRAGAGHITARPRSARSAGRGGMVTQAVRLLVHFPACATAASAAAIDALRTLDAADVRALLELIDGLRHHAATISAQLLQRYEGQPLHARLVELASEPSLVTDPKAAAREFASALDKIRAEHLQQRFNELARKERELGLDAQELQEFQELMQPTVPLRTAPKR